jgi:deoxyribonuclease V
MRINKLHSWDLAPSGAAALQRELAGQVDVRTPLTRCELVAGGDVSYARFSQTIYAGVVVVRVADGSIVEKQGAVYNTKFPYIPGFLSFREGPALLEAFAHLKTRPDAVMFDGQGLAHPRRFGLACHVGLWLNLPSLGCAKSCLVGQFREPGKQPACLAPLRDQGEVVGSVVRTKKGIKPVFVSAGHQIDLPSAVRVVLACCQGYRLPEPARQAHLFVNELRRRAAC